MIETREEYDYCVQRGYEPLFDKRFPMSIQLRREIQREKFGKNNAEGDAKFYAYCLKHLPLVCENCGKPIRHPWAGNVSHILTRGAHPEMAFDIRNVSILCLECHQKFEHKPTRVTMSPWYLEKVERTIEMLKKEYNE